MRYTLLCLFLLVCQLQVLAQQPQNRGFKKVKVASADETGILYEESHALVIGNSNYTGGWSSLPGVKDDIRAVSRTLEKKGFNVVIGENFTKAQLDSAYSSFIATYGNELNNRLLFYFAGHGYTVEASYGDKLGYLVPVDAPNPELNENRFQSASMEMAQVEIYAKRVQCKHALFVFDACFAGSVFAQTRAISDAISYKTSQPVRQFITSGDENEQVPDQSIFRDKFVQAISSTTADGNSDGYLTGTELGEYLQSTVIAASQNTQHPQYGKIRNPALDKGDFVFVVNSNLSVAASSKPSLGTIEQLETEGMIEIRSELYGKVFLDDLEVSNVAPDSSLFLHRVESGLHNLRIEGQENWWGKIQVKAGESTLLEVRSYQNVSEELPFMKMIRVEGGEFSMGTSNGLPDQQPSHVIKLDDFDIGAFEVTIRQFRTFIIETGYTTEAEQKAGDNLILTEDGALKKVTGLNWQFQSNGKKAKDLSLPVVFVTWNDAVAFTEWMTKKYSGNFSLPTEAQWEYAALGGVRRKMYRYAGSDQLEEVSRPRQNAKDFYTTRKKPNELGIYDMSGSVSEWCLDWYNKNYYRQSSLKEPQGPTSGDFKVLRGGSWFSDATYSQVFFRNKTNPNLSSFSDGFRVVRVSE